LPRTDRLTRWVSFHVSTGVVSVLGNVGVTLLVMSATGVSVVVANIVAVALMSLVNFWVSDRVVFRQWHERT